MFAAASAMVFLGPQAPPMPPPAAAVLEVEDPLDPLSAGGGGGMGGWGAEEAVVATAAGGAGGGAMKDNEQHRGESFNSGLPSPPLGSPVALLGSAGSGFAAAGAAEGRQGQDSGHGQPGGAAEFRRGSSRSPPADTLLSLGSPKSSSPVGGGRSGSGTPSVFGEVKYSTSVGCSVNCFHGSVLEASCFGTFSRFNKNSECVTATVSADCGVERDVQRWLGFDLELLGSPVADDNPLGLTLFHFPSELRLRFRFSCSAKLQTVSTRSIGWQIGPRRSLRAYPRPPLRSLSLSGHGHGHGHLGVPARRGTLDSPLLGDHPMAELTEGEERGRVVLSSTDDGGGGASGLGQGQQQHARVSGLLKNEMSALPSLAGFGMGGSVSFAVRARI